MKKNAFDGELVVVDSGKITFKRHRSTVISVRRTSVRNIPLLAHRFFLRPARGGTAE
jgi:hypothetical protein